MTDVPTQLLTDDASGALVERGRSRVRRAIGVATLGAVAGLWASAACKGQRDAAPHESPAAIADAPGADANLDACRAAAARVPGLPPVERAQALLDACRPCGDWQPLLAWNTPVTSGGPTRAAIEHAMVACRAFCEPNARQRFLGTLDAARGQDTRGPWRHLGDLCKAAVSAVPDSRFMGAPYFALDRIARALGALPDPALLAAIELPLPALSLSGVGLELPVAPGTAADAGPPALTVDAGQIFLGTLPTATLSPAGLVVSGDYPGTLIEPRRLAAALAARSTPVAVLAPRALPARRIVEVVAAAGGRDLRLAAAMPGAIGWSLPGTLPITLAGRSASGGVRIALGSAADAAIAAARAAPAADLQRAPPVIAVDATATTDGLAAVLGALAGRDIRTVALVGPKP